MENIEPHGWHVMDASLDLRVRQCTGPDDANVWQLCKGDPDVENPDLVNLNDEAFNNFREGSDLLDDWLYSG